jgi:hypothetical protein
MRRALGEDEARTSVMRKGQRTSGGAVDDLDMKLSCSLCSACLHHPRVRHVNRHNQNHAPKKEQIQNQDRIPGTGRLFVNTCARDPCV